MASDTNVGFASLQVIPTIRGVGNELTKAIGGPLQAAGQSAGRQAGQAIADGIANAEGRVRQSSDKLARARDAETAAAAKVAIEEAKLQELRDKGITGGSRWLTQSEKLRQAQGRQQAATRTTAQATETLEQAQRNLDEANNQTEGSSGRVGSAIAGMGSKISAGLGKLKGVAAVGGAAVGGAVALGITQAVKNEDMNKTLQASLGATPAEAKQYGQAAGRVYAAGMGDSMESVNEAVGVVASSFKNLGRDGEASLDQVTTRSLNFSKAFGTDVEESVTTVQNLMSQGLVQNTTQGFDLMTAAFQKVPAAMRGELPEILQEYGTNFHALGFTGEQAFSTLVQASQKGKFALDKTGDALKEFTIRGSDMSEASKGAYAAIGLDATEMSNKVAAGGAGAQEALQATAKGLLGIQDPATRANTAIALFGTPLEDLSVDQIPAFLEGLTGGQNAMEGFEGSTDKMGETLGSSFLSKVDTFKRGIQTGITNVLGDQALPILGQFSEGLEANEGSLLATVAGMTGMSGALAGLQQGQEVFGSLKEGVTSVKDGITSAKDAASSAKTAIVDGFNGAKGALSTAATNAKNVATSVISGTKALAANTAAWTKNALAAAKTAAITVATKAWAAAQWLVNAALNANPLGLIIVAVVALVGAIVLLWKNSETFRNIVMAAWAGIKTAVSAVWGWLSTSVFPFFMAALRAIGTVAMWLWNNAIMPAFNGIKAVIGLWWTGVKFYFSLWQMAIKAVASVAMWLWNNAIVPAFNGIKAAIGLAWDGIQVVFGLFKAGIDVVGQVVSWLWNNVMVPAWNGIKTAVDLAWAGIGAVFGFIKAGIDTIGNVVNWLWNEVMVPAWNGIKSAIETVWNFIKPILDNIGKGIQAVGTIATKVGDSMRNAFDGVVDVLKVPIHAVGKLLASVPEKVLGISIPGASTIRSWGETLQSLRTGGVVDADPGGFVVNASASRKNAPLLKALGGQPISGPGTGTSDSILAVSAGGRAVANVSNGETYFPPGIAGPLLGVLMAINGGQKLPAFAAGGQLGTYGLATGTNISYGSPWPDDWVNKLASAHKVKPSTYAGHQESDRNEAGYAPNPGHLNRGIDWSGDVGAMQGFAEYLLGIAPSTDTLEQIIWQNPGTGQKIGWHGRSKDDGSYFASDYGGHQDHVHMRASGPVGEAAAPAKPDTSTATPEYQSPDLTDTTGNGDGTTKPGATTTSPKGGGEVEKTDTTRLKTFKELGSDVGGILAGGIEETFDGLLPAWVWDPNKLIEGDDGSNVRTTDTTNGSKAGNKSINGGTVDNTPAPGIDPNKELKVPDAVKPKDQGAGNRKGADLYAYEIARAALAAGVGKKGATIGEATALVEAGNPLKMWANSKVPDSLKFPHDAVGSDGTSVGLFQQQQNGAWGTLADNMDPFRSAGLFYNALKKVSGWETMDPGAAAQAVQRSAFPGKYAQQMGAAEALLARTGLFDTGGIFQPGTLAYNDLNEPELVLKKHQWGVMDRNAKVVEAQVRQGASGGGNKLADVVNIQGYTAEEISEEWRRYQWSRTAGYGTSRHR